MGTPAYTRPMSTDLGTRDDWTSPGARALLLLHERELRRFLDTWKRARAAGVQVPEGPAHVASLEAVLYHVLRAAGGYLVGACQWLELPDPGVPELPPMEGIEAAADGYLDALLAAWATPLRGITEEQQDRTTGETPWGVTYCVDALLEHAVVHPMRHTLQLEGWLNG